MLILTVDFEARLIVFRALEVGERIVEGMKEYVELSLRGIAA